MTAQLVKGYLDAAMRRFGFVYTEKNGYAVLTAGLHGKRWKMAFSCGDDRLAIYAAYPGAIPHESRIRAAERLNELNAQSGFGCFFLLETGRDCLIIYRCDVIIADEYSITECIEKGFKLTSAAICARWDILGALDKSP